MKFNKNNYKLFRHVIHVCVRFDRKKYPVEELVELFPDGSGNLRADNFSGAWFLLENHHATSFEDLKSGLHFLGRKVNFQSTEGKLSFLKVCILMRFYGIG